MRAILLVLSIFISLLVPSCQQVQHASIGSIMKSVCTSKPARYIVDTETNIKSVSTRCDDYMFKSEKLRDALDYFVIGYSEEFGVDEHKVWDLLTNLVIETSIIPREVKNVYDIHGKFKKSSPVAGLALNPNWIWVEVKTKFICESAFIHEIVHIILWRTQKVHGDPDHEGEEYSGWTRAHTDLIKRVNEDLCRLDI